MTDTVLLLLGEAVLVYLLVLTVHALRERTGLGPFYALLGGLTAVMSWVTDAGISVQSGGVTFMVGSTVFYTSILLGAFVIYVFDGPRAARVAIMSIVLMSILTPLVAAVIHVQAGLTGPVSHLQIPVPDLRINTASVLTTLADLIFLAIAWEYLGRPSLKMKTWVRVYVTLLGVLVLDVLLFSTGAFGGTPAHAGILTGTLVNRLLVSLIAGPVLFAYVYWQSNRQGEVIENRPVLAILIEAREVRAELSMARQEIARRQEAEERLAIANAELQRLTERLHHTRERERAELGWELHDEIGQTLSVIRADIEALRKECTPEMSHRAQPTMDRARQLLDDAVIRLRRLYTELKPGMLDDLGLAATIEWQSSEFSVRTGIACRVTRSDEVSVASDDVALAVYRVFQEALDNVAQHSAATEVEVRIERRDDSVIVTVTDNGQGIAELQMHSPSSVGLVAMRERLRPHGGRLEVKGVQGKGTEVRITVPSCGD